MPDRSRDNLAPAGFGRSEREEAGWLIERALAEDLPAGDLTTDALFGGGRAAAPSPGCCARDPRALFRIVSREDGVLCGLPVIEMLFGRIDAAVSVQPLLSDGDPLSPAAVVADIAGPVSSVLRGERTALNFLQRLSGIAAETARWVEALGDSSAVLLDTRKTTPGWRRLEKYAVRCGGGTNHRMSLSHGLLLKDNHAWALRASGRTSLREWVAEMRERAPGSFLELEVDTREEFLAARECGVDGILLDNFAPEDLRWAVDRNRAIEGPRPLLEASGGIRREDLARVAATGVDRISVGALTHSSRSLDLSLECVRLEEQAPPSEEPHD